ncbi:hypothetical protein [Xanthomonas sp. XNM01]|uniref:hypothetical protein n=1 Tax=Xanthomonas sp. XNM01 TaxID=2769289 RepID=UPI0017848917|nr:hypothetical protein [Xanthomonas sp. XNM01]MBD9368353.1 hypothetical protein [Xanthomonas sp. XNM01]
MIALASIDPNWALPFAGGLLFVMAGVFLGAVLTYAGDRADQRLASERRRVQLLSDAYHFLEAHRAQVTA